jgi:hypothetical protein
MGRGHSGSSMDIRKFLTWAAAIPLLAGTLPAQAQDWRDRPGTRLSAALGGPLEAGMSRGTGPGNGILSSSVEPRMGRAEAYRLKVARDAQAQGRALLTSKL